MKKMACILLALGLLGTVASADLVAYWHFNDQTQLGSGNLWRINPLGTAENMLEYGSDDGLGTADLSVWGTDDVNDGNLVGTNGSESSSPPNTFGSFAGSTMNALPDILAGGSLSIVGSGNNDHYYLLKLEDAIEDCVLTYATRGTSTGYATHAFDYSTDNGATWHSWGSVAANKTSTWSTTTIDFGDVFAATSGDDANLIRVSVAGASGTTGNNRFDNIQINGTIVPEPAALVLLALGALGLRRR